MKLKALFLVLASLLLAIFAVLAFMMVKKIPGIFYVLEGALVILSVFLIYFYRRAVKPMQTIGNGMELLREQDFSSRLTSVGQYEADRLVDIFNRMMNQLKNERIRLREQNHFLDLLIDASPMGVIILGLDGEITSLNKASLRFLGIASAEDAEGKRLGEIPSLLAAELAKLSLRDVVTIRLNDSSIYRCSCLSFVECGYQHPFILVESLTEEVRKAEKKAYGKVIRMISHEVNNTTAGITSTLDTVEQALEGYENSDDLREVMRVCIERCYGMSRFITNFAEVVKIPAPQLRPCKLNELVASCTRFMEPACRKDGIGIHLNLCPEDLTVELDAVLFEQMLVNIVKNASESIGSGGDIYITTCSSPLSLEIADNGKGISQETEAKLFTPFFSTKPNGQGIGLILIREILLRHRCGFSLKTYPDGMTRFQIRFPQ